MRKSVAYVAGFCIFVLWVAWVVYWEVVVPRAQLCEKTCLPDLVWKCGDGWAVCVPDMPRSVKLEAAK